ncbi:MAG: nuclear transport factor 2 family protein [Chitinophagaceae bacterium]
MKINTLLLLVCFVLTITVLQAQTTAGTDKFKEKLGSINSSTEKALQQKDLPALMQYYNAAAVCMPEYHTALYNKPAVESYYKTWLSNITVQDHHRTIYEVQRINNYLIETGTFASRFTPTGKAPFLYEGKYIVIWQIGKNDALTRLSEIWGSSQYIDRAQLDFTGKDRIIRTPNPRIETTLSNELDKRNELICQSVSKRDGATLATTYTHDAVYMPYYSPMLVGIDKIRPYYIEHENPGVTIDSISIKASSVIKADSLLLVNAYYVVKWRAGNDQGTVTGKSINVWKRGTDGILMLYRQMVNHD